MPGKVLLTAAAAFMLAGAGIPASDMHLGRVADSADAVPSALTLEPANPTVSVRVSNTSGKPGVVVGKLGDRVAAAVVPDRSTTVTLTWDGPAPAGDASGVLRLELYPDGETTTPLDVEEHPVALAGGGYHQPWPKPSHSRGPWPRPSHSMSTSPQPSNSMSSSPNGPSTPSQSSGGELPQTGSGTSALVMLGGGSLLFGSFVLGLAWLMRRRTLRDRLS